MLGLNRAGRPGIIPKVDPGTSKRWGDPVICALDSLSPIWVRETEHGFVRARKDAGDDRQELNEIRNLVNEAHAASHAASKHCSTIASVALVPYQSAIIPVSGARRTSRRKRGWSSSVPAFPTLT